MQYFLFVIVMGFVARKPVIGISDLVLKTQTIEILHEASQDTSHNRMAKALIGLRGRAG